MSTLPVSAFLNGATRPELLISAQAFEEYKILTAIDDVDIIDLKNPNSGALAPTSTELWNQVADSSNLGAMQSLSAALGEFDQAEQCAQHLPCEFRFAKMGPSGCTNADLLQQRWRSIGNRLPKSTELVAVAYADFTSANSIPPSSVLRSAINSGLNRILIDTYNKDGGTSIEHLGTRTLQEFATVAQANNVWWSIAGSIDLPSINQLVTARVYPNCIGVRGAICEGSREQALSEKKCRRFCETATGLPNEIEGTSRRNI